MLVCPSGHATQIIEELEENSKSAIISSKKKRKINTTNEKLKELTKEEIPTWMCVSFLAEGIRVLEIPINFCQKYKNLISTILKKKPGAEIVINEQRKRVLIILYLIKRDYEGINGKVYLFSDLIRKVRYENDLNRYFTKKRIYVRDKLYKKVDIPSPNIQFGIDEVISVLKSSFPGVKAFQKGIFGEFNRALMDKLCIAFGITYTPLLGRAFDTFLESLFIINFNNTHALVHPEYLGAAFLFIYYWERCHLEIINGGVYIVENVIKKKESDGVVQDYFCRELSLQSFKQVNIYLIQIEKTRGSSMPIFNKSDFPTVPFGTEIDDTSKHRIAEIIAFRIAKFLCIQVPTLLQLVKTIYRRYNTIKNSL